MEDSFKVPLITATDWDPLEGLPEVTLVVDGEAQLVDEINGTWQRAKRMEDGRVNIFFAPSYEEAMSR